MSLPARRSLRAAALVVACSVGLAACGSGGGTISSPGSGECRERSGISGSVSDHGTRAVSGETVRLAADDNFFEPTCVEVDGGGTLSVEVRNRGQALHNLSVETLGIDEDVAAGASVTVRVKLPASGALPFFCKYHVGAGMQGAFLTT